MFTYERKLDIKILTNMSLDFWIRSWTGTLRRQSIEIWFLMVPQSKRRANSLAATWGLSWIYWAHNALPDRAIIRWKRPLDSGDMAKSVAEAAPESSPKRVTESGSPPKASMFSFIHVKAANWSKSPQLPVARSSPVLKNPTPRKFNIYNLIYF